MPYQTFRAFISWIESLHHHHDQIQAAKVYGWHKLPFSHENIIIEVILATNPKMTSRWILKTLALERIKSDREMSLKN